MTRQEYETELQTKVTRMLEHLEHVYNARAISQKDYDLTIKDLHDWAALKLEVWRKENEDAHLLEG
jgi:hypothetical protein